jgi:hypothetical protein
MIYRIVPAMFFALAVACALLVPSTQANPVPYPVIRMPYEYINTSITITDTGAHARVNGTYPFENIGYQNISMSYPLPSDATNVSVYVDQKVVSWWYTGQTYASIFGDLPVINWTISPAPSNFTVEVDYEHSVPLYDQNFTYFYAMGTWKNVYAKQMTAYVTADITEEFTNENKTLSIHSYEILFNSTNQEWIWKPLECTVSGANATFHVSATVHSDMFAPINGDFLLTFKTEGTTPEFSLLLISSLLIISALLATIIYKRKHFGPHSLSV